MAATARDNDIGIILDAMRDCTMSGSELREIVNATRKTWWAWLFRRYSRAGFYSLMADLERKGFVKGFYKRTIIDRHITTLMHFSTIGCRRPTP